MAPPFDIFRVEDNSPVWQESSNSLDAAKVRVQVLGGTHPGKYLIYGMQTPNKIRITVDGLAKSQTA
jgi:hypothetical protein